MFSKNSPRGYNLLSGGPLVLVGWQRKNDYNLHQAQIRHRRNLRSYGIASVLAFIGMLCICYGIPIQWDPEIPAGSLRWWKLCATVCAGLAIYFFYSGVILTKERRQLKRYIKKHRRFRALLKEWGYTWPMPIDGFILRNMRGLQRDQEHGQYLEYSKLFGEFDLNAPNFTLATATEEELAAIGYASPVIPVPGSRTIVVI